MTKKNFIWVLLLTVFIMFAYKAEGQSLQTEGSTKAKSITVGKGPDAMFLTPGGNYLYIANVEDSFISIIDTRRDEVVATIDGTDYPWGFTRLGKSNLVAVSAWDKGIDIIDFTTHKIFRSKRYEENLGGIVSTKNGKTLFVVSTDGNKVLKIDAGSLEILDEYSTGDGPDGVGLSKSGGKLYVTNTKDGTISIIDVKTKQATLLEAGNKPELIHSNHDRSRLFISNFFGNKIHVIDSDGGKIVHEISGLDGPEEAVLSTSEKILYVVNFNSSKVFSYDAETYKKLSQEYAVGTKPIGVVSAASDSKLYVTNYGDNSVSVIDLSSDFSKGMSGRGEITSGGQEILVKFKADAKEPQVRALESEVGLKHVKTIAALNLKVYKVVSDKSLEDVIAACENASFVEYAEPNQKVGIKK